MSYFKSEDDLEVVLDTARKFFKADFNQELSNELVVKWLEGELERRQLSFVGNRLSGLQDRDLILLSSMLKDRTVKIAEYVPKPRGRPAGTKNKVKH